MRTTIRLDDDLFLQLKQRAATSGKTLTAVIEDALRQAFSSPASAPERKPFRMITFEGNGMQPGVDLDDSAALLELMEADDPPGRRR